MALEIDVKYMLNKHFEPKVPKEEVILKQLEFQLKRGKSSANVLLDVKGLKNLKQQGIFK